MSPVAYENTFPRVEVSGGIVTSSEDRPSLVGQFRFFIDYVFEDDDELTVWDGDNHSAAISEALNISRHCDCPAFDISGRAQ